MSKNDLSLKELITAFSNQPAYKERLNQARVRVFWKSEMGQTIANEVEKIWISKRVLYLSVRSSVVRQELHMSKTSILNKMNALLDETYLQDVIVR